MEKRAERTEFLTPQQAAKLLNLPTHKVLRMIHRKKLRAVKLGTHWYPEKRPHQTDSVIELSAGCTKERLRAPKFPVLERQA